MTKIKSITSGVRLFGGGASETSRPTIDTPSGPIYAGTEQANQYLALKAWVDPLVALSKGFDSMNFEKVQALKDIAALVALLSDADGGVRDTLLDLSEAMQGRLSNHSRMNFSDPGRAFVTHIQYLSNHAARCVFGMGGVMQSAPRPPHPDAGPPQVRRRWGEGPRDYN